MQIYRWHWFCRTSQGHNACVCKNKWLKPIFQIIFPKLQLLTWHTALDILAIRMAFSIKDNLEDNTHNISQEDNHQAWDTVPQLLCRCCRKPENCHDNVLCEHDAVECHVPEPWGWLADVKYTERVDDNESHEEEEGEHILTELVFFTYYYRYGSDHAVNANYSQQPDWESCCK